MFDDKNELNSDNEVNEENDNVEEIVEDVVDEAEKESAGNTDSTQYESTWRPADENESKSNNDSGKKKINKKVPIIVIACVVVLALFATGIYGLTTKIDSLIESTYGETAKTNEEQQVEYPTIGSTVDSTDSDEDTSSTGVTIVDVSDVVDAVMPSIVAITSTTYVESNNYYDWLFGNSNSSTYETTGAGSGIIVEESDSELLIVTNNHVVEGADSLTIKFIDDTSVEGYIKGTDSEADLAIVSIPLSDISEDTLNEIKKATLGDSDEMQVGDGVIAIGNALGYGQSVTTGVISAKDRDITVDSKTMTVLQTDAAINGGNSGGALLNSKGEVIGINCAKYSSSTYSGSASIEGMGFAIPISSTTDILNDLMNRKTRTVVDEADRGSLGIRGFDVSAQEAQYYSMPQGICVTDVVSGGAADKAGIVATDVITKFDGQTVTSMETLQELMTYYSKGEQVTVTVSYRDGREYVEKEVEVTLSGTDILTDNSSQGNN